MIVPIISTEDLKKLLLRAIVALAARCGPAGGIHSASCPMAMPGQGSVPRRPSTVPSAWRRTSRGARPAGTCPR